MTQFTIGLNTCFAATRCPTPEEKFRIARSLGVRTVQYSMDALGTDFLRKHGEAFARRVRTAADTEEIAIHSVFTGADAHYHSFLMHPDPDAVECAREWFRQAMRFAGNIGARAFGGFFGAMPTRASQDPEQRAFFIRQYLQGVIELADFAGECGLEFIMAEPMSVRREFPCTLAETREFLDRTENKARIPILISLDAGHHAAVSGDGPPDADFYRWLERFARYSPSIHLHQTDLASSKHWAFTEENNAKGVIRADRVLEAICTSKAQEVLLVLELFHPIFEPYDELVFDEIAVSIEYWKKAVCQFTESSSERPAIESQR